jgi:hypothetical protein
LTISVTSFDVVHRLYDSHFLSTWFLQMLEVVSGLVRMSVDRCKTSPTCTSTTQPKCNWVRQRRAQVSRQPRRLSRERSPDERLYKRSTKRSIVEVFRAGGLLAQCTSPFELSHNSTLVVCRHCTASLSCGFKGRSWESMWYHLESSTPHSRARPVHRS